MNNVYSYRSTGDERFRDFFQQRALELELKYAIFHDAKHLILKNIFINLLYSRHFGGTPRLKSAAILADFNKWSKQFI